jgi:SAM-dependent methyltransferase
MRRSFVAVGVTAAVAGFFVVASRSKGTPRKGGRRAFWSAFAGVPSGRLGRAGARVLAKRHGAFAAMAKELDLKPEDDLLDVGCGAAGLLAEQASHVHFVAGVDLSEIPLEMARQRLADRVAAGTAEVVKGDAMALPWADGRFSVVASTNCVKFVPDPVRAVQEMYRVLRPGGRAFLTVDHKAHPDQDDSGKVDAWGQWWWTDADAQRLMEGAGFVDVAVSILPVGTKEHVFRGTKPAGIATGR